MDANQKFCLKWNNFQTSVTSVFDNLRQDGELVDITLCCEGRKIKAHRMMLSACSPYFRDLLKENPCQHPVFFLKDASFVDLVAVVEFVYKGEVNVTQGQLASFLKTAEMLQVRGLAGDDYVQPGTPSSQVPTQQKQHKPPRSSASASGSAAPSPSSVRGPAAAAAAAEQPSVKRRRVSADGSSDSGPLSADSQPAEFGVKLEQPDGEEPDAGFGPPAPSGGGYDMAGYEAADVAGFLSSVADQGGAGDVIQHSSAGPSDEGAQQGGVGGDDRRWSCPVCGRRYLHSISLSQHMSVHRGDTTCPICARVFSRVAKLNDHLERVHAAEHVCHLCDKRYTNRWCYRMHMDMHAGNTRCPHCAMVFRRRSHLNVHLRVDHGTEPAPDRRRPAAAAGAALTGSWRCAQCNRVYKHLFSYQSHLKVHRGATTCRLCGRVYARVSLLNAHMETSHGIQRRRYHVQQPPAAGAWPAAPGRPDKVDTAGVTDSRP
ncbi:Broad-complex core protein isoform 6 [Amphibalanus amphitrite]|uniref:Broad-complex core protein isoform 6 n=1 Tax=Amphibalanus amphitrite TaxID=1232801 RepID=A0A6A4VJH8_AMPAM|nr:Broad-complex core protein isoform 6 [Amphibalanus amphitrite]KAF0293774.1 Broad-complex core protein isoform 6 [Amphibalanus amphitrite]